MIKEVKYFFKEHRENRGYIWKLAVSSAKSDTQKTTLGMYWNIIRDAVFFIAYGFFMMVIRGASTDIEGMPRLVYLFTGLVAWYFINDSLTSGVACIAKNKKIFTKIKFPILIIPTYETIAIFIKRIATVVLLAVILIVILIVTPNYHLNINFFGLLYSIIAMFIFGVSYTLFMSGFYTISKDFRELYKAIIRIQFYFVPVFWSVAGDFSRLQLPAIASKIVNNLPFVHMINAFRYSITKGTIPPLSNIAIFGVFIIIIFTLGCYIQYRLQRVYADFV